MTPEERAEQIIRAEALYGPDIDTYNIKAGITIAIREAVEAERNRCLGIVQDCLDMAIKEWNSERNQHSKLLPIILDGIKKDIACH